MNTQFTFDEIHQQPAMWRKELQALLAAIEEIRAFMHKYLTPDTDIVLTGAGTSAFIGDALQPVMRGLWRNVRSVATTDIVTHAKYLLDKERPLLLVSFARSGNSPESVAAVNLANKLCKNVAHVYITCNKNGKLALQAAGRENVLSLLLPEETDDKSLAMTSSFSTMLLTCLMLGHIDTLEQDVEQIEKAAKNAEVVIAEYEDKLKEIASRPFEEVVELYAPYKDRFRFWCCFDYSDMSEEGIQKACELLARYHNELGATGIGELGDKGEGDTYARPKEGKDIHIDDPRIQPLIRKAGELKMPISIHIAEPIWMYLPMDDKNDGLPNGVVWHVDTTNCYGYDRLISTFENAVRENPGTLFIACHYLNMTHDWPRLGALLDKYPNLYVDISARVAESAHTPRATREFLIKYQDRVLFGTDNGMEAEMYHGIFRVLETNDEHFYVPEYNYHWALSGFDLPDEVLRKIYRENALRILNEYK